jgi:hypothetical protein
MRRSRRISENAPRRIRKKLETRDLPHSTQCSSNQNQSPRLRLSSMNLRSSGSKSARGPSIIRVSPSLAMGTRSSECIARMPSLFSGTGWTQVKPSACRFERTVITAPRECLSCRLEPRTPERQQDLTDPGRRGFVQKAPTRKSYQKETSSVKQENIARIQCFQQLLEKSNERLASGQPVSRKTR